MKPNLKRIEESVAYLRTIGNDSSDETNTANNLTKLFDSITLKSNPPEQIEGKLLDSELTTSIPAQDNSNHFSPTLPLSPPCPLSLSPTTCKAKLQQIIQQIQDIYDEGPLIDGWLEFNSKSSPASYLLCAVDADGKMWTHPCPPEQIPSVSIAIARYQKILQLLKHKRQIETILNSLIHSSPDK